MALSVLSFFPPKLHPFPSSRKVQASDRPRIAIANLSRRNLAPSCSGKRSRKRRALKSNEELCDELREFISTMGLPDNRAPSTKELSENGRKDLANIVRRRGYKAITELLLSSNEKYHSLMTSEGNQDFINANLHETKGTQERSTTLALDSTFSLDKCSLNDMSKSNETIFKDSEELLHLKGAKFSETGEFDAIEGKDFELYQDLDSEIHEQDNQNEMNHIKILMDQNELELSQLKQQIEEAKDSLSNLQAKGTVELVDIQRMKADKDIELLTAEGNLNGLKEVHIDYWTDGQIVEVAGSFNGWQHRIRMSLHPSSEPTNPPGSRNQLLWTTVLWLYPGVYEIKFIVDGHWQLDRRREITNDCGMNNNVLEVD